MFAVLTTAKGAFSVNLTKILFFYTYRKGTRLEMEDGTLLDVEETFPQINSVLAYFNALRSVEK